MAESAHTIPKTYWNCASAIPSNKGPLLSVRKSNSNAISNSNTINEKNTIFLLFIFLLLTL
jgi:hypothetical protein